MERIIGKDHVGTQRKMPLNKSRNGGERWNMTINRLVEIFKHWDVFPHFFHPSIFCVQFPCDWEDQNSNSNIESSTPSCGALGTCLKPQEDGSVRKMDRLVYARFCLCLCCV